MPATYEPIATTTSGAVSTVTFSSIPATYTDLRLVHSFSTSGATFTVRFNSDTGSNYSVTLLNGNGTAATSSRLTNDTSINLGTYYDVSSSGQDFITVDIFSYLASVNKTCLITGSGDLNNGGGDRVSRYIGLWRNTGAITSITIGGSIRSGVTTLYGILKA